VPGLCRAAAGLIFCTMSLPDLAPGAMVASAIAPALLLLWLVVAADSRPEPPRVVWIAVGLGALAAIPAGLLELLLMRLIPISHNPWIAADESALLFAAIPEEAIKVSIIAAIALRARDFDEPMDGVVYGTAVGLGFAAIENVLYLLGAGTHWGSLAVIRGVLSVPLHGALGAIAGAFIVRAHFGGVLGANSHDHWRRPRLLWSAWLIPVVLHALFDAPVFFFRNAATLDLSGDATGIVVLVLSMPVVGAGTIVYAVRLARRIAHHQKAWLETKRLPPAHWRGLWAQCLVGVGSSFAALPLVFAGNWVTHIAGWVLLVCAIGIARRCGRYLSEAAVHRHRSAIAPPA
jgi:RsiW-degrading membrane proteinase PrsW (M82 family)